MADKELDPTLFQDEDRDHKVSRGDFVILEDEDEVEEDVNEDEDSEEEDNEEDDSEDTEEGEDSGRVSGDSPETDEEEGEEEEAVEEETGKKGIKIPKGRFDEVTAQRDAERERVKWLEDQLEKVLAGQNTKEEAAPAEPELEPYDFEKAEEKYIDLVLEGETKVAAQLRAEINREQTEVMQALIAQTKEEALQSATDLNEASIEDQRFEVTVQSFEQKHGFLNAESDDYNEEAVDTINTLMTGMMQDGMGKAEALSNAVKRIAPMYAREPEKESLGSTRGAKRTKAAKSKAAEASKKQPPNTGNSLKGSKSGMDDIDLSKITEDQFSKLSKKELAMLRGDVV